MSKQSDETEEEETERQIKAYFEWTAKELAIDEAKAAEIQARLDKEIAEELRKQKEENNE